MAILLLSRARDRSECSWCLGIMVTTELGLVPGVNAPNVQG